MSKEVGYCHCGCGQKTNIAKRNDLKKGWIKGRPVKYIHGHNTKAPNNGCNNPAWKGGKIINGQGYVLVNNRNHPKSGTDGYIQEHTLIAEEILGEYLPNGAVVHHVNGIKSDNRPENLVICQDNKYHKLLHRRQRAYDACGNANYLRCPFCKEYDDPENLFIQNIKNNNITAYHRECKQEYQRRYYGNSYKRDGKNKY